MTDDPVTTDPAPGTAGGGVADLFPGYFALVMATGIIAVAADQQGLAVVAEVLFGLAVGAYVVLLVLTTARLVLCPQRLFGDLTHHATGFSFLTTVAATNVLAGAAALVRGWWSLTWVLFCIGLALWGLLLYPALVAVIVGEDKPPLGEGINGTWFLMTVATESVAVTGALLLARGGEPHQMLELVSLAAFTLGLVLYLIVMTLLFLRWSFSPLGPDELQPPSWIAAGAVAITVLAGSNLLASADVSGRLYRLSPFVEGTVVLAWATATFWFPVMIAIGVWRHLVKRVPLRYHPAYWALVFPIGMYGAATYRMADVTGWSVLDPLPELALVAALVAWAAAFGGLVSTLWRSLRPSPRS